MRIRVAIRRLLLLTGLLTTLSACESLQSARHEYLMRGQVLEATASEVLICVGSSDGARTGQELSAYRFAPNTGRPIRPPYERVQTGTVRIGEVIDEHFARAQVTSGAPAVYDIVELHP